MPRYLAKAPLFLIDRYIEPGETFVSDLTPGRNWQPLDVAAPRAAEAPTRIDRPRPHSSAIDVPADWAGQSWQKRRMLAIRLGAERTVTADQADSFIEAELARRVAA